jgi:hypothetical protein
MIREAILATAWAATLHSASAPAMELRVEGDRVVVAGSIDPEDDFQLLTALVTHRSSIRVVQFHEMLGGDMPASLRMGNMIRGRQLDTLVTSFCMSGCAFAFLGGVNRRFATDESGSSPALAFHAPFKTADPTSELPASLRELFEAYISTMTAGRAEGRVIEHILRMGQHDMLVFGPPSSDRSRPIDVIECRPGRPVADSRELAKSCVEGPRTSALEQGFVTANSLYRLTRGTPYQPP